VSFVDKDHSFIKRRADSVFGPNDTGFKLTMLYVVGVQGNRQGPNFKLYPQQTEATDATIIDTTLKGNTMILFNSRAFEYEVGNSTARTCLLFNQVPGPAQPPLTPGPSFISN